MSSFPTRKSSWDRAVPPGRIDYRLSGDPMLVHTFQSADAFDQLLRTGRLTPDPRLGIEGFEDAYKWIYARMAELLPTTGEGAVWFWARTTRAQLVDECRHSDSGEVLLTCRIPRERLLLSHFSHWHDVLNAVVHVPVRPGESDDEYFARFDLRYDDLHDRLKAAGVDGLPTSSWPTHLRAEIEESWMPILDPSNYGRHEIWQATAHQLHAADVVEAVILE